MGGKGDGRGNAMGSIAGSMRDLRLGHVEKIVWISE
jgi:hypothetical protein